MTDPSAQNELRRLREKAYGAGGVLSDAEADRLRELQEPSRTPTAVSGHVAGPTAVADDRPAHAAVSGASPPARPSRTIGVIALALLLLALGAAGGWAFARSQQDPTIELSTEQLRWETALVAAGDFDTGSVRPIAVRGGVVVWSAMKDDGEQYCVVIADGAAPESTSLDCALRENALAGEAMETVLAHAPEQGETVVVSLSGVVASDDSVVVTMQEHPIPTASSTGAADDVEATQAMELVRSGFLPETIHVAARIDEAPIWVAQRADGSVCMVIDAERPAGEDVPRDPVCAASETSGAVVSMLDFDAVTETTISLSILPGGIPSVRVTNGEAQRPQSED
ncbi:hypothetical protein ACWGJP_01825 [Microbacterium sp. NPDC055903]